MGSQRTIITISDEDTLWLENYSRSYGISMAEAIRRGIGRLRDEEGRSFYQLIVRETKRYLAKRRWAGVPKKSKV